MNENEPQGFPQNQQPLNPAYIPQSQQPLNPAFGAQAPQAPAGPAFPNAQGAAAAWNPQQTPPVQPQSVPAAQPGYPSGEYTAPGYAAAPETAPVGTPVPVTAQKKKSVLPLVLIAALSILGIAVVLIFMLFNPSVKSVEIDDPPEVLYRGASMELEVKVQPGKAEEKNKVTWDSSDHTVATVSKDGTLTAVGSGTCKITATAGKKSDSFKVRVNGYNQQEEKVLGKWKCTAIRSNGEWTPIQLSDVPMELNEDLTGSMEVSDSYRFKWSFEDTSDDGDPIFMMVDDGTGFPAARMMLNQENDWIVIVIQGSDNGLVFERDD